MEQANKHYQNLVADVLLSGERIKTRNSPVYRVINAEPITFDRFPLVTIRKTAALKAIREMEWFLSRAIECPDELLSWWKNQLYVDKYYIDGYSKQLREFSYMNTQSELDRFDQIKWLINELKTHPNSRRLLTTTWNPGEMADITENNHNPNTPTTCHGTVTQYFVSNGALCMKTYQRSADLLLGVPHNWAQYWAYLVWLADMTGYKVGWMRWDFGDLHIYDEESHIKTAKEILEVDDLYSYSHLWYRNPDKEWFKGSMFHVSTNGELIVQAKPKLL